MATPRKPIKKVTCSVCRHPERHRIELLRFAGTPTDTICEKYTELGRDAIYRHMANHVDAETKAAMIADVPLSELAERAAKEGGSLLDHFHVVRLTCMDSMKRAAAVNDYSGTAALAKRTIEVNREIGRLTGEMLSSAPIGHVTNIYNGSPIVVQLETMLIERLAPFPDALRAVLAGLEHLDGGSGMPVIEHEPQEAFYAS